MFDIQLNIKISKLRYIGRKNHFGASLLSIIVSKEKGCFKNKYLDHIIFELRNLNTFYQLSVCYYWLIYEYGHRCNTEMLFVSYVRVNYIYAYIKALWFVETETLMQSHAYKPEDPKFCLHHWIPLKSLYPLYSKPCRSASTSVWKHY